MYVRVRAVRVVSGLSRFFVCRYTACQDRKTNRPLYAYRTEARQTVARAGTSSKVLAFGPSTLPMVIHKYVAVP